MINTAWLANNFHTFHAISIATVLLRHKCAHAQIFEDQHLCRVCKCMHDLNMMMMHATSSNRQVESCEELKFACAFFKYLRILASVLKQSQLALTNALLTNINLCLSNTA